MQYMVMNSPYENTFVFILYDWFIERVFKGTELKFGLNLYVRKLSASDLLSSIKH